jgi:FxsC-like protein
VSYYFFLSYARGDDDLFVQRFFRDLSSEVRSHAGLSANEEVGFFDAHSLEVGATWSTRLVRALSQCRSFVALCSPRYFVSEPCGKEWAVFAERLREYEHQRRQQPQQPAALLPLLWLPPRHLPPVVAALQYDNGDLPEAYRRAGLRQLMRLQRHQDSYIELVSELASQIVQTADTHRLPNRTLDVHFEAVPSVFHPPSPGTIKVNSSTPAEPAGGEPPTHYVHFVVSAPARDDLATKELAPVRTSHEYYGDSPLDWAPYRLEGPIVRYARAIAAQRSFESGVADISNLGERLAVAMRNNHIVILLVDAWSTRLPAHRQALAQCDDYDRQAPESTIAVMVPSSADDGETQLSWRQLGDSLRAIFRNRTANGDEVMFRPSVLTHDAFNADLQVVLEVAKNRIFVRGKVFRSVRGEPDPRPILEAP